MTTSTVPPIETVAPDMVTVVREGDLSGTQRGLIATGIAALVLSGIGVATGSVEQAYFSYLVAYMFCLSLVLGSLFFVMLHHVTRAGWSVVVRRVAENVMALMPWMVVLFIPIVLGRETLFHHWLHPDPNDTVLAGKAAYLNAPFFFIRAAIYFTVWTVLALWFRRTSIAQDQTGDAQLTLKMSRLAAPGIMLFALTLTFAAFDWMMSLDPHWYSTIFGVCYFAGSVMAIMAFLTLLCLWLNKRGYLKGSVSVEHYHDLGKLMFAFMIFWTYVNFSQYFLIWYANIPEETSWFQHRLHGGWSMVGTILILGHFAVPFIFLMSRHVKRNLRTLTIGAVFMLIMHWIDMQYLIMPNMAANEAATAEGTWFSHLSWLDATTMIGMLALITGLAVAGIRRVPVLPQRDPRLRESLDFENH